MRKANFSILMGFGLAVLLAACATKKTGTEPDDEEAGGGLPQGHYLIQQEMDGESGSQGYFVVLPDSAWENVLYQISNGEVCNISRIRGTYALQDTALVLIAEEEGHGPRNKCPNTQSDFENIIWEAIPAEEDDEAVVMKVRNVGATSFEASGEFAGPGWKTFYRQADPYGYYD